MAEEQDPLTTMYAAWQAYQERLTAALALLTADQLGLRAAPDLRSIRETGIHIVGCRLYWFTAFLGEDSGEDLRVYARWNEVALEAPYPSEQALALALGTPAPTAGELAQGLERTWRLMAACLARWGEAGLRHTFPDQLGDGTSVEVSRAWVVWHVLEHDLHHGGELSLTLGMHGLPAAFAV
jgi:uncharacterized damage-inducible protein DinB